jgi:outer membrane receptor protein involved in Fe transport
MKKINFTCFTVLLLVLTIVFPVTVTAQPQVDLFSYSLEQLGQITFIKSAALTPTTQRDEPASVTRITHEQIRTSGARDLNELLEIYVPGLLSHNMTTSNGRTNVIRGSSATHKALLLVNGRDMNERFLFGVLSENYISTLRDIESIEVIRGPGSAIYGAGAINTVISIKTFTGDNFEGMDISVTNGQMEEYVNLEFRMGHKFATDNTLFLYAGIDSYEGGDIDDSPYIFGSTRSLYTADQEITDGVIPPLNQSFNDEPRYKVHAQWNYNEFETWLRYTKGGTHFTGPTRANAMTLTGHGYDQLTLMVNHKTELTDNIELKTLLSYDYMDLISKRDSEAWRTARENSAWQTHDIDLFDWYREEQWLFNIGINWKPADAHQLYLGLEYSDDKHLENPGGYPDFPDAQRIMRGQFDEPWSTQMQSLITEYQWTINDQYTLFAGGRIDKHSSFDKIMNSPKVALIYKPGADHTFKFLLSKSVRRGDEYYIKLRNEANTDEITVFEVIYHQHISDELQQQVSFHRDEYDILTYSAQLGTVLPTGTINYYGIEWELSQKTEQWVNLISVAYNKLLDLSLIDPTIKSSISASPQGFGDDFNQMPNWVVKLTSKYQYNYRLSFNGSLITYYGFDGRRDYYEGLIGRDVSDRIDDSRITINLGSEYKIIESMYFRINAHNILGWVDQDYNNRQFYDASEFRPDVPSLSLSFEYGFGK